MKGFQLTSGVLLITIGLFSLQTEVMSAYTMKETCAHVSTGWIADPASCQGWGYCRAGSLLGTGKCNDGFLFDTQTGTCNTAENVNCMTTVDDICENLDMPQMIADPNDCNRYCYCDGNNSTECTNCDAFQFFNPATGACVWSSQFSCPADSICRLVPNNKFAGDPDICGNYIHCVNGAGISTPCANGQYFNPISGFCENTSTCSDDDNDNGAPITNAGPGVVSALPNNAAICGTSIGTVAAPEFFSDLQTCMGFYVCTSTTGPGTWAKCPLGTHFNAETQQCVTPFTVVCPHDRCGNINQTFVTSASATDLTCTSYLYCVNQTTRPNSSGTCPANFEFFNEASGNCIPTKPTFAICGGA